MRGNSLNRPILTGLFVVALVLSGCFKLDDFLFNSSTLESYDLPNRIVPDSLTRLVQLNSGGQTIYGVFVRSGDTSVRQTVLYSHGNKDHLAYYWDRVEYLWQAGFNVFIYDYRGFGMSQGSSDESSLEIDAKAALDFVRTQLALADTNISLMGYSLGGVPTLILASRHIKPKAVLLEAAFASGEELVRSGTVLNVPGRWLLNGSFSNLNAIETVKAPVTILHGSDDTFIGFDRHAIPLFERANQPKFLQPVPGAGHGTIPKTMGDEKYIAFLRQSLR